MHDEEHKEALERLYDNLDSTCYRFSKEFGINNAEIIGTLRIMEHQVIEQGMEDSDDDKDQDDD